MIVLTLLSISLIGCGGNSQEKTTADTSAEVETVEVKGLEEAIAEQPAMLTSVGQSADVQMVKSLMNKAELQYEFNTVVKPEELENVKSLILAVGGSSKGLGAAGIKAEDEIERANKVIEKAKEMNIPIIALHIGGEMRRGELSDKFVNAAVPKADYVIIVEDGNKDGLFTKFATEENIPMDSVKSIAGVIEPLKKAFK